MCFVKSVCGKILFEYACWHRRQSRRGTAMVASPALSTSRVPLAPARLSQWTSCGWWTSLSVTRWCLATRPRRRSSPPRQCGWATSRRDQTAPILSSLPSMVSSTSVACCCLLCLTRLLLNRQRWCSLSLNYWLSEVILWRHLLFYLYLAQPRQNPFSVFNYSLLWAWILPLIPNWVGVKRIFSINLASNKTSWQGLKKEERIITQIIDIHLNPFQNDHLPKITYPLTLTDGHVGTWLTLTRENCTITFSPLHLKWNFTPTVMQK